MSCVLTFMLVSFVIVHRAGCRHCKELITKDAIRFGQFARSWKVLFTLFIIIIVVNVIVVVNVLSSFSDNFFFLCFVVDIFSVFVQQFDGAIAKYYHPKCFFEKFELASVDDIQGMAMMRWDDQQKIREFAEGENEKRKQGSP